MYLWALAGGARSEYYAAIALSMSKSWSNFVFGAMDPTGTVSLDKIPGSYWVPALFVRIFGFSTWSVDAPNAIATAVAVVLVAVTAKRIGGPTAGMVAGLVTATTPILAAVARTNQPESFFVLALALVAWAGTKAVQRGSLRWLVIAGAFVALAFHMYMLVAWSVWPALAAAYLCTQQPWARRIGHVLIAGVSSALLSLTWILIVTLTPASARPWVGGSNGNSAWEMVFGYNGLGRFADTSDLTDRSFSPPFAGDPGVLRLFNAQLAGQTAWFLPAALAAVAILIALRRSFWQQLPVTVFLSAWTATMVAMFSVVAGMHQFYTAALAIPVGLLVGLAFAAAWQAGSRWALVTLIGCSALTAVAVTRYTPAYLPWVVVAQVVVAVVAGALILWWFRRPTARRSAWVALLAVLGMLLTPAAWAVDVVHHPNSINPVAGDGSAAAGGGAFGGTGRRGAPGADGTGNAAGGFGAGALGGAAGGAGTGGRGSGNAFTGGGPGSAAAAGGAGGAGGGVNQSVLSYAQTHRGNATYLLAAFGGQAASYYITATDGDAVLVIGGFGGSDPTPSLDEFTALVRSGELRFVLTGGAGPGIGGGAPTNGGVSANSGAPANGGVSAGGGAAAGGGNAGAATRGASSTTSQIQSWVTSTCTPVASVSGLYDCAGNS